MIRHVSLSDRELDAIKKHAGGKEVDQAIIDRLINWCSAEPMEDWIDLVPDDLPRIVRSKGNGKLRRGRPKSKEPRDTVVRLELDDLLVAAVRCYFGRMPIGNAIRMIVLRPSCLELMSMLYRR
jgi:hypothetical protein